MSGLFDWFSWKAFLDLSSPELVWILSTGRLLPYCIAVILIIYLLLYIITKRFIIKKPLTAKNYITIFIGSLIIYYILWVILLNIFAIAVGRMSQYF